MSARMRTALLVAGLSVAPTAALADLNRVGLSRNALWLVVEACSFAKRTTGASFPCLAIALAEPNQPGTAILRAPGQPTHTVIMPTRKISGLEDPVLQTTGGAYWRAALAARHYVTDAVNRPYPVEDVAMAVNSKGGRSQDQLHLHLDCVQPHVRAALNQYGREIGDTWKLLPVALQGSRYFAMKVPTAGVERFNPFAALTRLPEQRTDLSRTSAAMISTARNEVEQGFYILAYRAPGSHAEALLDHSCSGTTSTATR